MSFFRLLLSNLFFHRRGNFAVFLGVALGTAVLTGALLVGDSLRGSLKELALDQLGWVGYAMPANRLFRADLANEIGDAPWGQSGAPRQDHYSPALLLRGSAAKDSGPRVNKTMVWGVDDSFWSWPDFYPDLAGIPVDKEFWQRDNPEVVLNETLARDLNAKKGDKITLNVQKAENIPREYLLGKRQDVVQGIEVKVVEVLSDRGLARFTLQPTPEPVRNAFVPQGFLQKKLGHAGRANILLADEWHHPAPPLRLEDWNLRLLSPDDRARAFARFLDPTNKDADAQGRLLGNVRHVKGAGGWRGDGQLRVPEKLAPANLVNGKWVPADRAMEVLTGKKIREYYEQHRNYFLLESGQILLEDAVIEAVNQAFPLRGEPARPTFLSGEEEWWLCPTLAYMTDSISDGKNEVSYAVVAGQGPLPGDKDKNVPLEKGQIDLARYPGSHFYSAKPGDVVTLSYYAPDDHSHLQKLHEKFTVRKTFPLEGRHDDPDLVPQVPGITDKLDRNDWRDVLPFPYDERRGKTGDRYWHRYRTTPQAYINLEQAQKLWGSRFGKLTSYRVMPLKSGSHIHEAMKVFRQRLEQALNEHPEKGGFVWLNLREQGEKAGGGSTDFAGLFLGFSFFLIAAALMLVGLLFRLNLDLRAREIGILLATGWTFAKVRRLLLGEGILLAILGALVGLAGALVYADLLLWYLSQQWPGEQKLQFLHLHVTSQSLAIGWFSSVAVSVLTILWATRILGRMTPTRLLAGETTASAVDLSGQKCYSHWVILGSLLGAMASFASGFVVHGHEAQAGSFFGSGFLVLVALTSLVWRRLRRSAGHSNPRQSLAGLAVRNAGRHAVRSVLTIGLLASANFLIVAVESFHKDAGREFLEPTGGSGGFPLYGQADVPIFQDLNDPAVRDKLTFPAGPDALPEALQKQVKFYPCRLEAGDDASCLNLYQPQSKPRILGVPNSLIQRGGFRFARLRFSADATDAERENPWLLLESASAKPQAEIPVFVDGTSAEYVLHKSVGETYEVTDGHGDKVQLRIVGLFDESVFQSEMVMSDANFRRLFPRQEGFSFFLIECPADEAGKVKAAWESALNDYGLSIETTSSRLERYLAVENTYLATFQALGGLGLLLGAAGLAIVLLHSVWERRGELALLRALGFRRQSLAWLVLAENAFLLLVGLAVGSAAALFSVAPHLWGGQAHMLGLRVLSLLGLVLSVGLASGLSAVLTTLRAPLLQALRHE